MASISISVACTGCGACIATCPERALRPAAKRPAAVAARCTLCLACIEVCPVGAIDVTAKGTAA
jgi:NAD-dependent dihydropyrimidine dehydrogenase PreA subunit